MNTLESLNDIFSNNNIKNDKSNIKYSNDNAEFIQNLSKCKTFESAYLFSKTLENEVFSAECLVDNLIDKYNFKLSMREKMKNSQEALYYFDNLYNSTEDAKAIGDSIKNFASKLKQFTIAKAKAMKDFFDRTEILLKDKINQIKTENDKIHFNDKIVETYAFTKAFCYTTSEVVEDLLDNLEDYDLEQKDILEKCKKDTIDAIYLNNGKKTKMSLAKALHINVNNKNNYMTKKDIQDIANDIIDARDEIVKAFREIANDIEDIESGKMAKNAKNFSSIVGKTVNVVTFGKRNPADKIYSKINTHNEIVYKQLKAMKVIVSIVSEAVERYASALNKLIPKK